MGLKKITRPIEVPRNCQELEAVTIPDRKGHREETASPGQGVLGPGHCQSHQGRGNRGRNTPAVLSSTLQSPVDLLIDRSQLETRGPGRLDDAIWKSQCLGCKQGCFTGMRPVNSHRAPDLEGIQLGLMLCCRHFEILHNIWTGGSHIFILQWSPQIVKLLLVAKQAPPPTPPKKRTMGKGKREIEKNLHGKYFLNYHPVWAMIEEIGICIHY